MLSTSLLTALLGSASLALALPNPLPQDSTTGEVPALPYATNTTVFYYTGSTSSSCGYNIGQDTLQAGVCNKITTQGLGIQQVQSGSCTYTLWSGSTTCDSSNKQVISIANGDKTQCFLTGVEDGGKYYKGSGVWSCG